MTVDGGPLTGTPLRRFCILEGADLGEAQSSAADLLTACRLAPVNSRGKSEARVNVSATGLGPVRLVYVQTIGAATSVEFTHQECSYDVNFALQGVNQMSAGNEKVALSLERAAILSPGMVASMRQSDGYEQLHVRIERFALERHLERMVGRAITRPIRFQIDMDLTRPASASWTRGVKLFLEDLDEPSGLSAVGAESNPWSDFLMTGLLLAQPHNYSEWLACGQSDVFQPQSLKRAMELIEREPGGDLSLERLCSVAGLGSRALQRHFREYAGTSPRQYVQWVRLGKAHDDLVIGSGSTVAEIAYRWGFTHVPRFAGAYHERYGELPSETLRRSSRR